MANAEAYDEFRVSAQDPGAPVSSYKAYVPPPVPTPTKSASSTQQPSVVAEFRKEIKRDKTHYIKLKGEKQWDD